MRITSFVLLLLSPFLIATGCKTERIEPNPDCPDRVLISAERYNNSPADELIVMRAAIQGDCLYLEFSASGCDGSTWELRLIDASTIMESYPIQRSIRLSLNNNEDCDAVISREIAFDITPLQLAEYDKIYLNLANSGQQLLYMY